MQKNERYFIEVHVLASEIKRFVADRPDTIGLVVPTMPYGSPGMGPEDESKAYDVNLMRADSRTEVFQLYS